MRQCEWFVSIWDLLQREETPPPPVSRQGARLIRQIFATDLWLLYTEYLDRTLSKALEIYLSQSYMELFVRWRIMGAILAYPRVSGRKFICMLQKKICLCRPA
ncbi:hypothetical protein ACET3Z_021818 [Daucus carota]